MHLMRVRTDLRSAWRGVVVGRWSSVVAVAALTVGIGASVTAASVAYGGLLRALPLPEPDRLLTLRKIYTATGLASGVSLADFDTWRDRLSPSLTVAGYAAERVTLRSEGAPLDIRARYIAGDWFQVLGARAERGRLIDDASGDDAVVSRKFADRLSPGDPAGLLGHTVTIGARPLRIVGVLPASFAVVDDAELWVPARGAAALTVIAGGDARDYRLVGRVVDGRSVAEARASAAAAIATLVPASQEKSWQMGVAVLRDHLLGDSRPVLLAFVAASLLLLLIACANVAMLLVNRAADRAREFAVRVTLGASRARLLLVATLETTILALAGAAGGAGLARLATASLGRQTGLDLPPIATVPANGPLVAGAALAGILVVGLCGAAPLVALRRAALAVLLRSPTASASRASQRVRGALVVAQLAMTVVLLTGAGLLGRTLLAVSQADIGLDRPERVVTLSVPVGESPLPSARLRTPMRILEDVRQLPDVRAAGFGAALPPATAGLAFTIRVSRSDGSLDSSRTFDLVPVTDGYLEALGARLVEGRFFTAADSATPDPVCVLSESAVKHLALVISTVVGRELNMALPTASGSRVKPRVVGVIKDIRYSGMDAAAHGGVYVLWRQLPVGSGFLVARTAGDPVAASAVVLRLVREADPSLPLRTPAVFSTVVERALAPRAARFGLVGVFAAGATLLGIIGLFGAMVKSVVERQRELAIRSAVGATPRKLLTDVLRRGFQLAAAGVTIGLLASAWLAKAIASMLVGVTPRDPLTYAATSIIVLLVAMAACYWPARRAASANPVVLLRSE